MERLFNNSSMHIFERSVNNGLCDAVVSGEDIRVKGPFVAVLFPAGVLTMAAYRRLFQVWY